MSSQSILNAYLDALLIITDADMVAICNTSHTSPTGAPEVVSRGHKQLPFFQTQQQITSLSQRFGRDQSCRQPINIDQHNLVFRLLDGMFSHEHQDNSSAAHGCRRSQHKQPPQEKGLLALGFAEGVPQWLIEQAAHTEQQSQQQSLFLNLLYSGHLQLEQVTQAALLQKDALTRLDCRTHFQSQLDRLLKQQHKVAMLMIHCMDFHHINRKFGHHGGDQVIVEIAENLQRVTRDSDLVSRFGGALFAIAVAVENNDQVMALANKVQTSLQQATYLTGAISLAFDLGIGIYDHEESHIEGEQASTTLLNNADLALKSAQSQAHPAITVWQGDNPDLLPNEDNHMSGIFTADTVTDYRNMLLLWDLSNLIASQHQIAPLINQVVERFYQTFDFSYAGIISYPTTEQGHNSSAQFNLFEPHSDGNQTISTQNVPHHLIPLLQRQSQQALLRRVAVKVEENDHTCFTAPLHTAQQECFVIYGDASKFVVSNDVKMIISALIRQLGKAINRIHLEQAHAEKLQAQKNQLQDQLTHIKEGLKASRLYYQSQVMTDLMKQAKRAALTDTTTLIIGESGTGKERLVHAVHHLGPRQDKPLVIVDCASIPETLIESELFGHVKGAFTGAQQSRNGRILEADGGTLVLDEIGELPLLMQSKLLRFVQEKYFTPVGSTKSIKVDVKIIAVTNRELQQEVDNGNFRQDLFYRLNVVTLCPPPLRQRPEDIPLLSQHFLQSFARENDQAIKHLSADALEKMRYYPWPGNIRELENCLMRANLMCEGDTIQWQNLNIAETAQETPEINLPQPTIDFHPPIVSAPVADTEQEFVDSDHYLDRIEQELSYQVEQVLSRPDLYDAPVGKWLENSVITMTFDHNNQNLKQTALRLALPQSTLRRRLEKIRLEDADIPSQQLPSWSRFTNLLAPVAQGQVNLADSLETLRMTLLKVVLDSSAKNMAIVAAIMGVSEPTLYKMKRSLTSQAV